MMLLKNNFSKLMLICIFSIFSICTALGQEVCDNGIDDDADGFIDLNDTDCVCSDLMASSLIPNPSFEDMLCCPLGEAELECAEGWIQASVPTTDYVHTCGNLGNEFILAFAPLPIPDGQGAIGFRDGKPGEENFKEYAGSCLTQAMTVGTEYRLDFFVGFNDRIGSMDFDMAVFGTTDCNNLPFGGNNAQFGCPTNGPGWVQLGAMSVSGENEWKNVVFDFIADQSYEAIVLGPACAINPNVDLNPYFFFDRLVLAESIMFEVPLADVSGNICEDNLVLTSSDAMGGTYQWYQEGIAIPGETNQSLNLNSNDNVEGIYEVVVTTDTGCFDGEEYSLIIPSYNSTVNETFCMGGSITIGGEVFDQAGSYDLNLIASDGCDSLVTLNLDVTETMTGSIAFDGCEGETITVNNESYNTEGSYTQNLISVDGCDSILTISYVTASSTSATFDFEICEGDEIFINGQTYTETGNYNQQLVNAAGCDSTIFINVINSDAIIQNTSFEICEGSVLDINGQTYTQAGSYSQNLTASSGCDSILNISLSVLAAVENNLQYEICQGGLFELNGQTYDQSGNYIQNLTTTSGCDSILNISLTVFENASTNVQYDLCQGDIISLNGETFNQAGNYTQNLVGEMGCDSIINISISILPVASSTFEYSICEEENLELNGEVFFDPGNYTQIFTAANGCDSLLYINILLADICRDCVFFTEFNSGSIQLTKLENNHYQLALVDGGTTKMELTLSENEFLQFSAFYLVDNELQISGKGSQLSALVNNDEDIHKVVSSSTWNKSKKFTSSEILKSLPYIGNDIPEEINDKKLNHLFNDILSQTENLKVGAQMKIEFR